MKPSKMTNEMLVLNLELWLALDGKVEVDAQREFFEEIIWRLLMSNNEIKERENIENGFE